MFSTVIMNNSTNSSRQSLSSDGAGHHVIMALGSNVGQRGCMVMALSLISKVVSSTVCTRMVWTEPVGVKSDKFLNCLLAGRTLLGFEELSRAVKNIERQCGRTAEASAEGRICMDIDILEYDGARHHHDDWDRTYIKQLMNEI